MICVTIEILLVSNNVFLTCAYDWLNEITGILTLFTDTIPPPPPGPPETEYGRAIHCDATNYGTLWGDRAAGGDTGPPTMVGTTQDRLEAGAGTEIKSGGSSRTHGHNCREEDNDGYTRIGKGNGGGGVTGGQWIQWGWMERGGGLRTAQSKTGDTRVETT